MTIKAHDWIGAWEIDAPLTKEQAEEDRPLLEQLMAAVPYSVTVRTFEVWINGREYRWRRIDTTRIGS